MAKLKAIEAVNAEKIRRSDDTIVIVVDLHDVDTGNWSKVEYDPSQFASAASFIQRIREDYSVSQYSEVELREAFNSTC